MRIRLARGGTDHRLHQILRNGRLDAVHLQKGPGAVDGRALVGVQKGVSPRDRDAIECGELEDVRHAFVALVIAHARKQRLDPGCVDDARQSPVAADVLVVADDHLQCGQMLHLSTSSLLTSSSSSKIA